VLAKKILRTQFALYSRLEVKASGYRKESYNIGAITIDDVIDNKTTNTRTAIISYYCDT